MIKMENDLSMHHECKLCKMIYSNKSSLERHTRHVHAAKIKCTACGMEVMKKYYRHHLKKVHAVFHPKPKGNDENENKCIENGESTDHTPCDQDSVNMWCVGVPINLPSSDYPGVLCEICNQVYSNKVSLKKHIYNVHRMVRVKCNVCSKEVNKKSLRRHMANVHSKISLKETKSTKDEEKICCSLCGKKCPTSLNLEHHIKTLHKEEVLYKCTQCDYQGIKKQVDKHMKKEHNVKVHQCGHCHKILKSKSTLKEHMWIHTDHRRFICDVCGMRFKRTSNYYGHMKSHQEKKFQCRVCGNFFLRKRYLVMHEQTIHNYYGDGTPPQEKGYQCEICGVKLKWKNNLVAHMRIHTGEKPYKCKICGEDFTCHGSLRTHMTKHSVCESSQGESNTLILQAYLGNRLDITTSTVLSSNSGLQT